MPDWTLTPLIRRHLDGRRRRNEVGKQSLRNLAHHLDGFAESFGRRSLDVFGPAAVRRWQETVGHLSAGSRRNALSAVRQFSRWLVDEGLVERDACRGIRGPRQPRRVPRALPAASIGALLRAAPDARGKAVCGLMVYDGLRAVEVSRLEWGDFDRAALTLRVTGKGGHQRLLPVPTALAILLDDLRAEGAAAGPMIRGVSGAALAPSTVSMLVRRWLIAAEVKRRAGDGVSGHSLRHSAATDCLERCRDVSVVQRLLGHSQLQSTAVYLRVAGLDVLRQAVEGRDYGAAS